MIAVIVVSRWITLMREDIAANPDRHLLEDNDARNPTDCPSHTKSPICCPCVSKGWSRSVKPKPHLALILAPAALIENWQREWNKFVDMDVPCLGNMQLLVGYRTHALSTFRTVEE